MSDIVERLRSYAKDQGGWHNIDDTCEEAADEIERLRAENVALRQSALQHVKEANRHQSRLAEAVEVMEMALKCTPSVIVPSDGGPVIVYDCGDPWELLRAFLAKLEGR